jgi:hypothetical protein
MTFRDVCDESVRRRFWSKVDTSAECWLWLAHRNNYGYGKFRVGGRSGVVFSAHRLSWAFANGRLPGLSEQVLHSCDNPACVNPRHLRIGTHADNMRDMAERGRAYRSQMRGVDHPCAKLSNDDVLSVLRLVAHGATQESIAGALGVTQSTISRIVVGHGWKHIDREKVTVSQAKRLSQELDAEVARQAAREAMSGA